MNRGISFLIHGPAKSGKTTLADTAPAPRLFLDVERASDFTPSRKTHWNPRRDAEPPQADGTWDTAVAYIREPGDIQAAYRWLNSGRHPFRSVIFDSISEGQVQARDEISGGEDMDHKKWGKLLREFGALARNFRDLPTHPVNPLDAVVITAITHQRGGVGDWTPYVQGQLSLFLPHLYDVLAYMAPVPSENGETIHRLLVGSTPGYDTGERVGGKLGHFIDNPNIEDMLRMIRGQNSEEKVA